MNIDLRVNNRTGQLEASFDGGETYDEHGETVTFTSAGVDIQGRIIGAVLDGQRLSPFKG